MSVGSNPEVFIRPSQGQAEACFCVGFMIASEPWITLGLTFNQAIQRLTDPTREVHVAIVHDEIIGVVILHLPGPLNGYIQTIAVHPDWRCRGIGTRMIEWTEERIFHQSPNVFLCVSSFNHHAQDTRGLAGFQTRRVNAGPNSKTAQTSQGGSAAAKHRFGGQRSQKKGEAAASP